jgi:hypothetical protein
MLTKIYKNHISPIFLLFKILGCYNISSGGSFLHLLGSEARVTIKKTISGAASRTKIHFKPPRKKEFSPEQKGEALIAKSQPLKSQDSAVNLKPSKPQRNDDSLDFQFCKMFVNLYKMASRKKSVLNYLSPVEHIGINTRMACLAMP